MSKPMSAAGAAAVVEAGERTASGRGALASLSLSILLSSLGSSIANVGLPTLAQAFHASFPQVQGIVLAYLLAITALSVSVGWLGDRLGRRRLLLAGLALFTLASVLCSLAPTLGLLIAARAVQGVGAAIMMALTTALVGETVPREKTGRAMGLLGTSSAVGTALGPSLGGVLISELGWRAIFLINVPLGLLTLLLAQRYLPVEDRAMAARVATPLFRRALFRNPVRNVGLVANCVVAAVLMATMVVGPFYLVRTLGLEMAVVGAVVSVGPIVAALSGIPAGRLVDRLGAPRMTSAGLAGIAVGAGALALLPTRAGVVGYVVAIAIITAGYALFQAANNTAVMAESRPDQRGVMAGLLNLSRNLGLLSGSAVMGAVFALGAATTDITTASPEAVATGLRITFAVAAALVVAALVLAVGCRARGLAHK